MNTLVQSTVKRGSLANPRKVLFLTTDIAGLGGVQYAGRLMLRALQDWCRPVAPLGYEHDHSMALAGGVHCASPAGGVALITINDSRQDLEPFEADCRAFGGGRSRISTGLKVLTLLKREQWDVVVLGHLSLVPLLLGLTGRARPRSVAFIHGLEAWQPLTRLRRMGLRQVDRLLYNSLHTRKRSLAANPWLADRPNDIVCPLGLLPDGDPVGRISKPASASGRLADLPPNYTLIVGRMSRSESYKGHEELIRIWPVVARQRPDFPLLIAGDGDDRPRLEDLARRLNSPVRFLGKVDAVIRDQLLAGCRCFCMPSRGEGLGLVYLEAMRAGKPVLAGSTDAGAEVVVDGVTGRTVDPVNPQALLEGLLDVSGDRAGQMGQAGRRRFQECYSYERFRERFSHCLDKVSPPSKPQALSSKL
jgi:phosphatidyl-myo-inositol dimannoside synthase